MYNYVYNYIELNYSQYLGKEYIKTIPRFEMFRIKNCNDEIILCTILLNEKLDNDEKGIAFKKLDHKKRFELYQNVLKDLNLNINLEASTVKYFCERNYSIDYYKKIIIRAKSELNNDQLFTSLINKTNSLQNEYLNDMINNDKFTNLQRKNLKEQVIFNYLLKKEKENRNNLINNQNRFDFLKLTNEKNLNFEFEYV